MEITLLRKDEPEPLPDPVAVSGWQGTLQSFAEGVQHDDAFVLAGNVPVIFGIESAVEGIAGGLVRLRDAGPVIKI